MMLIQEKHPPRQIESQRLILKARSFEQAPEVFALIDRNREHLKTWMPWEQHTDSVADSEGYLIRAANWWDNCTTFDFSVYEKSSGQLIGSFGLHSLNWQSQTCEVGYWLGKEYEGKGYATECVALGEGIALDLGFHRIVITCDRLNFRSHQVALRNGYLLESNQIDHTFDRGKLRDTLQFVKFLNPPREGFITTNLPKGYAVRDCESEEFQKFVETAQTQIFDRNELLVRAMEILNESEKQKLQELNADFKIPYSFHRLLFHENDLAGWTWGYQDSPESFYMVSSAVLSEHRGRGLYSRLLEMTLEHHVKMGFQRIWSRHSQSNNSILVPKLKRGFLITGTEVSDTFGLLIHLTYFPSQLRQKIFKFRSGNERPTDEIKKVFKL